MQVLFSFQVLVWLCITSPSLKKYVMEPIACLGQVIKGIAGVLCNFEHEQYPSSCVDKAFNYWIP